MAPDSLTCGVCRKEFPLGEIVRFIQHKVLSCNKENYRLVAARAGRGGDGDANHALQVEGGGGSSSSSAAGGAVATRRPSISAPINSRRLTPTLAVSSSTSATGESGADDDLSAEGASAGPTKAEGESAKTPSMVDAESNTVNSGEFYDKHCIIPKLCLVAESVGLSSCMYPKCVLCLLFFLMDLYECGGGGAELSVGGGSIFPTRHGDLALREAQ